MAKDDLNLEDRVEAALLQRIEAEVQVQIELGLLPSKTQDLTNHWESQVLEQPKLFLEDGQHIKIDALRNFRRLQIFVQDVPTVGDNGLSLRTLIGGGRRGGKKRLRELLGLVQERRYVDLLGEYPCPAIGNPHIFSHQGYQYTDRWLRHIYFNGLVNQVLNDRITSDFVVLDIGSSYGSFSSLFKRNHPDSHHVLVDFSEQLLLAYYFLGMYFPEAKIAGVKEISDRVNISREFIEQYDFVLAPVEYYTRLAPKSVDLISNFRSLGEMSRKWFETYLDADVFSSAKYFFTANRVQSYPSYNSDLSILDYPIWDRSKLLHFELSPFLSHTYGRSLLFFNKQLNHSPIFEYLGGI